MVSSKSGYINLSPWGYKPRQIRLLCKLPSCILSTAAVKYTSLMNTQWTRPRKGPQLVIAAQIRAACRFSALSTLITTPDFCKDLTFVKFDGTWICLLSQFTRFRYASIDFTPSYRPCKAVNALVPDQYLFGPVRALLHHHSKLQQQTRNARRILWAG